MSCEEKVVCVTGASGFIASWIVKLLLQRGYTVRATVRDLNDPKKTEHLMALEGAKERLHLFKAELLQAGSFDPVVQGCHGVIHTASHFSYQLLTLRYPRGRSRVGIPLAELIEPAVTGTLNVLASCAKVPSLKRVVVTSSMAAVSNNGRPLGPDVVVDETWFSDPAFCEKSKLWYMLSKTLAEEAAWKFAEGNGIDLVTINPGLVIGPILQPTLNTTIEMIFKLVNGSETYPNSTFRYVDVRDVATTHILAFEKPSASGRYCLVGHLVHCRETVDILRKLYPQLQLPEKCEDDKNFGAETYQMSKEKAKALGVEFTPLEVTLKDTVESLKKKGFL